MPSHAAIVSANLALLEQGRELVARLPDSAFADGDAAGKPVGPQFRHVLEHYSCFLAGIGTGRIDYDARQREAEIENDRAAATRRFQELSRQLSALGGDFDLEAPTEARLECGIGAEEQQWSGSTIRRELHFLLSHTIHHYALIGLLLRARGIDVGDDFGVAPSTLKYWNLQVSCAPQAG